MPRVLLGNPVEEQLHASVPVLERLRAGPGEVYAGAAIHVLIDAPSPLPFDPNSCPSSHSQSAVPQGWDERVATINGQQVSLRALPLRSDREPFRQRGLQQL